MRGGLGQNGTLGSGGIGADDRLPGVHLGGPFASAPRDYRGGSSFDDRGPFLEYHRHYGLSKSDARGGVHAVVPLTFAHMVTLAPGPCLSACLGLYRTEDRPACSTGQTPGRGAPYMGARAWVAEA